MDPIRIRCHVCGQFCRPYDEAVHYGQVGDLEPPDSVYWCRSCAMRDMQAVAVNPRHVARRIYWIKPGWLRVANSILRHRRRHKAPMPIPTLQGDRRHA